MSGLFVAFMNLVQYMYNHIIDVARKRPISEGDDRQGGGERERVAILQITCCSLE
jgi:hypothetical protein